MDDLKQYTWKYSKHIFQLKYDARVDLSIARNKV